MTNLRDEQMDEVIQRGQEWYENQLRESLESHQNGQVVAIDPESGDYSVAEDSYQAMTLLRQRHPAGIFFVRRIGAPTPEDRRLASRLATAEFKTLSPLCGHRGLGRRRTSGGSNGSGRRAHFRKPHDAGIIPTG
jgi:hypothetical protein